MRLMSENCYLHYRYNSSVNVITYCVGLVLVLSCYHDLGRPCTSVITLWVGLAFPCNVDDLESDEQITVRCK